MTTTNDDHGNDFDLATLVQFGATVAGNIEQTRDTDFFKFTPSMSGVYIFESLGKYQRCWIFI